ncbi:hypothetical protein [Helicobacter labetoulli]
MDREELIQEIIEMNEGYSSDQLDDWDTQDLVKLYKKLCEEDEDE